MKKLGLLMVTSIIMLIALVGVAQAQYNYGSNYDPYKYSRWYSTINSYPGGSFYSPQPVASTPIYSYYNPYYSGYGTNSRYGNNYGNYGNQYGNSNQFGNSNYYGGNCPQLSTFTGSRVPAYYDCNTYGNSNSYGNTGNYYGNLNTGSFYGNTNSNFGSSYGGYPNNYYYSNNPFYGQNTQYPNYLSYGYSF